MTQAKDEKTTPPEGGQKTTAGMLREMIRQEITSISDTLFKKDNQSTSTPAGDATPQGSQQQQAADVKGEVARALQSLRAKEDRDARDAKVDELLAAHEAAKKAPEKPPVEQRRVHKIMGWGE